jgi:hypothetical protein
LEDGQTYKQVTPGGSSVPVIAGENTVAIRFRIYNNFGLAAGIAPAENIALTVYDGAGSGSHTCAVLPVSQSWVHAQMYGFGENSVTSPDAFTYFLGENTAIGGSAPCGGNSYIPEEGSDGVSGSAKIRAYSNGNGMGYIEFSTYVSAPDAGVASAEYGFAFSLSYEWTP